MANQIVKIFAQTIQMNSAVLLEKALNEISRAKRRTLLSLPMIVILCGTETSNQVQKNCSQFYLAMRKR